MKLRIDSMGAAVMAIALAGCLTAANADAAQRTFVASFGNDANPCSLTFPCRSFAAAIATTGSGGEVIVLDSAGYGPVTVTQSVSIIAPRGVYAGISVFPTFDGVSVDGPSIAVTLRGLTINGQGGSYGVIFTQGTNLTIDGCTIRGMGSENVLLQTGTTVIAGTAITQATASGVRIAPGASATIVDSRIESNGGFGVWLLETAKASIERSVIAKNGLSGINLYTGSPATVVTVFTSIIADHPAGGGLSVQAIVAATGARIDISGNTIARNDNGIEVTSAASGFTTVNATNNQISDSSFAGIFANNPGTTVRASGNAILRGQYGLNTQNGATIYSPGSNYVHDNSTLDDSTHTADTLL